MPSSLRLGISLPYIAKSLGFQGCLVNTWSSPTGGKLEGVEGVFKGQGGAEAETMPGFLLWRLTPTTRQGGADAGRAPRRESSTVPCFGAQPPPPKVSPAARLPSAAFLSMHSCSKHNNIPCDLGIHFPDIAAGKLICIDQKVPYDGHCSAKLPLQVTAGQCSWHNATACSSSNSRVPDVLLTFK